MTDNGGFIMGPSVGRGPKKKSIAKLCKVIACTFHTLCKQTEKAEYVVRFY